MIVNSVSKATASSSSSSSAMTSSQAVCVLPSPGYQQQQQQRGVDIRSMPSDDRSSWQHTSVNGCQHRESPDHSPRRLHGSDLGPYHARTTDRSPLRQHTAGRSVHAQSPLGRWHAVHGSPYCSSDLTNGLVSGDSERMDTSDEMPLNLTTRVGSCAPSTQQSANFDSRRRILTSGRRRPTK